MKKLIIIGAGVSGLTAGVFAAQSGMETTILEQHSIPGGVCTSWKRGGYLFEGAIHWMTGSGRDEPIHPIWKATGALSNTEIIQNDPFTVYYGKKGPISLYRNLERFEAELLEASPKDMFAIRRLTSDVRAMMGLQMPVTDIPGLSRASRGAGFSLAALAKMAPALMKLNSFSKISIAQYVSKFQSRDIRGLLLGVAMHEEYYAAALIMTLATLMRGDGGYPKGGSLPMTRRMAGAFLAAGGKIEYNTRVDEVVVENGQATGVRVGSEKRVADAVIVTTDTLSAVDTLFNPPLSGSWIDDMRTNTKPLLNSILCIGIRGKLTGFPGVMQYPLDQPIEAGGETLRVIGVNNYADYEGYAPNGCTALTCITPGNYAFWKAAKEQGRYEEEKQLYAATLLEALEAKLPQIKGRIDVTDVATPLTYERYTSSFQGSWMSVVLPGSKTNQYPGKTDVSSLYFAGQRQMPPGGLPVALIAGRRAAQLVCKQFGVTYRGE